MDIRYIGDKNMETKVFMPRLGANDDYIVLASWIAKNGDFVKKGDTIAIIETTKETGEIKSPADGYFFCNSNNGATYRVGDFVAVVTDDEHYQFCEEQKVKNSQRITNKAQALINKHHIDISVLSHLDIIREKDVLKLIDQKFQDIEMSKANELILVGGGGLAKMCVDVIFRNKDYNIAGIVDHNADKISGFFDVCYLGDDRVLRELREKGHLTAVNCVGGIDMDYTSEKYKGRERVFELIKNEGFFAPVLIHPSAKIAVSARISEGTLVFENAVVGSDAVIYENCIINTGAIVSHDCVIGRHSRVSPGAILAGDVTIGSSSLIGMGVTVYMGVHIGNNVVIANGKDVFTDVPDNSIVR